MTHLAFGAVWPTGVPGDLYFEGNAFSKKTTNRNSNVGNDCSDSGACRVNKDWEISKKGDWFIEEQRWGAEAIVAGVVNSNIAAIERGLKILEWGFKKQSADGSFVQRDAFHSAMFFIEAVARAILYIENSKYKAQYASRLADIKAKLLSAVKWAIKPEIETPGIKKDEPYVHRFYLNAAAFGLTGSVFNDATMLKKAESYIQAAILLQDKTGANPEKGGSDTGYHAIGLVYAARCYSVFANEKLRINLKEMGKRGSEWLLSKVQTDGSVDSSANTRTGDNGEIGRDKTTKTIPYFSILRALAYWGAILETPSLVSAAEKVYNFQKSHRP